MTKSFRDQAEEIMTALEVDRQTISALDRSVTSKDESKTNNLLRILFNAVSEVDLAAAEKRVVDLKATRPDLSQSELVQTLIREKCQATAAVGAVTSGVGLIPGIGTAMALILGVAADLGATFKLQAELVLEIAAAYDYPLTESEKHRLVFFITGLNVGTTALAGKVGRAASIRLGERLASKSVIKALPIVGLIASAGTNVLTTYIIGRRAEAYFWLGPEAIGSWRASLRAITGLDDQKLKHWLVEGRGTAGTVWSQGASGVETAGQAAGGLLVSGLKKIARAFLAGFSFILALWSGNFHLIGRIVGFSWAAVTFVPRQLWRFFTRAEHIP